MRRKQEKNNNCNPIPFSKFGLTCIILLAIPLHQSPSTKTSLRNTKTAILIITLYQSLWTLFEREISELLRKLKYDQRFCGFRQTQLTEWDGFKMNTASMELGLIVFPVKKKRLVRLYCRMEKKVLIYDL